jgi:hypothetical protein
MEATAQGRFPAVHYACLDATTLERPLQSCAVARTDFHIGKNGEAGAVTYFRTAIPAKRLNRCTTRRA